MNEIIFFISLEINVWDLIEQPQHGIIDAMCFQTRKRQTYKDKRGLLPLQILFTFL
jgi:hypothetical protein